jgi:AcrR family transcriptional regulator
MMTLAADRSIGMLPAMKPRVVPRVAADLPALPPDAMRDGTAGRILSTALRLFARDGYHATSIRDIGDALGLKAANLYDHFTSKEHLLAELVRIGHAEHLRALQHAVIHADGPIAQLQALVRAHVRVHAEYAMLSTVASSEMHALSPELVAPALALRRQSEDLLGGVILRGVAAGVFEPPHAWVTAAAIGGMGLRVAYWFPGSGELSIDEVADIHAELALRMLTPRDRARS